MKRLPSSAGRFSLRARIDTGMDYEVALSFAGEDRVYAEALASSLRARNVLVFYDVYEQANLWGKDLYVHLSEIFHKRAAFCVMFISRYYAEKLWTNHERRAAQARAFQENGEYILPIRLDDTDIPGLLPTTGYLSWPPENQESVADAILIKLGKPFISSLHKPKGSVLVKLVSSGRPGSILRLYWDGDLIWKGGGGGGFDCALNAAIGRHSVELEEERHTKGTRKRVVVLDIIRPGTWKIELSYSKEADQWLDTITSSRDT